ncbi:hypothetical protein GCM10009789_50120 [Kribbella sancticallisti]|uniref:Asparagine synthase (Glutamine-hydrolysing) n=1 Tax=Kribbella sancticallisti TaxID=460087 RepID=A0ABN2E0J8_9ACTN
METVVAYAFDQFAGAERAAAGVRRVEAYYGGLWQGLAQRDGCDAGTVGLHSWSRREPTCRWPAWQDDDDLCVASLHAPLGYETIVGDLTPGRAAGPLARAVLASPARMLELAPPFVLMVLDPADERLELFTDSVGLGRMFQLRTTDGWVWSNRPVAACLFADVPVAAATRGWRYAAGCGWFMGDTTPYDRVLAVPGATRIVTEGRRSRRTVTRIDATSIWSGPSGAELSPRLIGETADALRGVARSVSRLWPGTPTVDLSGGRDSRVVAAAFLSAGVDLRLNSYDAVPGEVQVAEQLVAALPYEVEHVVTGGTRQPVVPAGPAALPEVVERIKRWHRYGEGLRPASYLFHTPGGLAGVDHLAIGGAGGEVAHGHFYPRDVLAVDKASVETRVEVFAQRLQARLVPAQGPTAQVRDAVTGQIRQVFREAIQGGFEDSKMLDYFYVVERLRRWGTAGERSGVVSPLLVPAFVRGAFALSAPQRMDNALHRALVRELVPQWAEIPFFTAAPKPAGSTPARTAQVKRLADVPDRELVEKLLTAPAEWTEDFEIKAVSALWASSVAGRSTAADEVALRQLLWRAVFEEHLSEVNQHITQHVPQVVVPRVAGPVSASRSGRTKRRLRRMPAVRRLARTRVWRTLRSRNS